MSKLTLDIARNKKNDEFYTQISDIEKELINYKDFFKNKIVYCNCDDPNLSMFFLFFKKNFYEYGLKKLIVTHYNKNKNSYKLEIIKSSNAKLTLIEKKELESNGDFRDNECIELLMESDIVVTNPPFSLFREYIDLLIKYNKNFLIIGNHNAITYKNVFQYIKDNLLWLGINNGVKIYEIRGDHNHIKHKWCQNGKWYTKMGNTVWYTNIKHYKRDIKYKFKTKYKLSDYKKYDNFDAINVNRVKEIPNNYKKTMGVPISFLNSYNPNQFQIIGYRKGHDGRDLSINKKYCYCRILIKNIED